MYWSLWKITEKGPFFENVNEEWVDARLEHEPDEIIFKAELVME